MDILKATAGPDMEGKEKKAMLLLRSRIPFPSLAEKVFLGFQEQGMFALESLLSPLVRMRVHGDTHFK